MKVCVFCSSSDAVDPVYFAAATEMGALIGAGGHTLVYGGGRVGMMGAVARAVHGNGGRVVGVIPEFMHRKGVAYEKCDELTVTADMRERKARMMETSEAFVALPGGFGTLEELSELITQLQFGIIVRPLALVNTKSFFDPLAALFQRFYQDRFAKPELGQVLTLVPDPAEAMRHIHAFVPPRLVSKWFS
ncbi:MAG TPA: TIGR00730 family Rossman fold protein [Spirochaetia bacterium]|nr:TIGR00730 family Rossman fold protein [Spirochaetia bacterium]